ncbi:hypothetical protein GCM10009677_17690 [Sphaerisporangium rubeum]|uniref:Uncharacterized protein n=1 Tax=Sphaerisporangium rubeum TaxID=321317 RepID=A0A7X0M8Q4_9ACTN|nr:hypothetical protein [Sphaerisporangium rubeum]MBB6475850.1 hypothetical protein [Sphaerisporangium rubeum]
MSVLCVPVHVDALCLATDADVAGPLADFTRLPYVDPVTGRDVRADLPYVGEVVLPAPFEDAGLRLGAGVHLHWALPDALTRVVKGERGTHVPVVPNRWLVTRSRDGAVEGRWLVLSDVLSDDDTGGVAYPVSGDVPAGTAGRPYRFLGRTVPLRRWDPREPLDRLPELTAAGHGDPAFAAFYPNCHSVFGFHDPAYTGTPPAGLSYDVLGWYGDTTQDESARVLATAGDGWRAALADRLGWRAPADAARPARMVCFGRLSFAPARDTVNPLLADAETGVCVGENPTGALAAHLGATLPGVTPESLEDLLEALAYAGDLENATLDLSIGLDEARHTAAFTPITAGVRWNVYARDDTATPDTPPLTPEEKLNRERLTPPPELDGLLAALNEAQERHDQARRTLTGLRRRLYADWYKYMLCAYPSDPGLDSYPSPDEVRFFLERSMDELDRLAARTGVHPAVGEGDTLAHRLAKAREAVDASLAAVNATTARAARTTYVLREVPGPRHYRPNEPVVLLTGSAATPSDRYGEDGAAEPDGLLPCDVIPAAEPVDPEGAVALWTAVARGVAPPHPAVRVWTHAPWHPVLLQWEAEFFPTAAGGNIGSGHRDYDPDFVTANYALTAADVELRPRGGFPGKAANVYSGTTVLSPSARPVLTERVLRYLSGGALAAYNKALMKAGRAPLSAEDFRASPAAVLDWYDANGDDERNKTLAMVYRHLAANQDNNLSQSLGGFNDALLMLRLARQLPVDDPLGFPGDRAFTARVAARIGDENRHAPQPLSDFNPIRAGALRVRRLRIVDNFGTTHDVDVGTLRTTTRLTVKDRPRWVAMAPRLAQPARVALRLLDAAGETAPLTGLPTCTPVCGWLLPAVLEDAVRVHTADGAWAGSIHALPDPRRPDAALWRPAPESDVTDPETDLANPHLRDVAGWLLRSGADGVGAMLSALDEAQASVEPEDPGGLRGVALLLGRPVAVVRAEVALDPLEPPAVHQDWNVFRQDMARAGRETNEFTLVRFPVRIGEHGRLSDGVLGYWVERSPGDLGPDYHDVQALGDADAPSPVLVGLDLPPRRLTVLLDPHGAIHATSGVLPTESAALAAEHYRDALTRLAIGLPAAPVLTDAEQVALPLPAEPGSVWSWLERTPEGWTGVTDPPRPQERFPSGLTVREGRLTLRPRGQGTP